MSSVGNRYLMSLQNEDRKIEIKIVNVNDFRAPEVRYACDLYLDGQAVNDDVLFFGQDTIDRIVSEAETKGAKWLYRLESIDPKNGLWYNMESRMVWAIGKLKKCTTKFLPMDYDERYHKDGKNWFSSCSNRDDLLHWFSVEDAKTLCSDGFVFTRYLATEFVEYENETTFLKESCVAREIIDIEELFAGGASA